MKKGLIVTLVILMAIGAGVLVMRSGEKSNSTDNGDKSQTTSSEQASTSNPSTAEDSSATKVAIKDFAYSPATLTVKKGTTVTWTNEDAAAHTVTSDSGSELQSKSLSKGGTFSHTFSSVGTFDYHCAPHPNMKASVVVTD